MRLPLNWISNFTDINTLRAHESIRDISHTYSIHTAEIEGSETFNRIEWVVVWLVLSAVRHPESTKLWICSVQIDADGTQETILTWAPNVYAGMYTAVAVVGCQLAPEFIIGERKMAGMISRGMMCGADEIGLTRSQAAGIIDLLSEYSPDYLASRIGVNIFDLTVSILGPRNEIVQMPLVDEVIEIDNKNMTNRPDLFGIVGHAREFAAVFGTRFDPEQLSSTPATLASWESSVRMGVRIESDKVRSYSLARVNSVSPVATPLGIAMLLERSGHTSHDAIVDMTNFVMMEYGQPMHAFDADMIEGDVIVRQARAGETLVTLDGKERALEASDILIADEKKILGLAGVMGGYTSRITDSTKNICIESAVFDPVSIRLTAQRLGLRSDASTRYEKSLDPTLSVPALIRGLDILHFSKVWGTIGGGFSYLNSTTINHITLQLEKSFITTRLGLDIADEEILRILTALEFSPMLVAGVFTVIVPSHRATKDVSILEDIVEEIGRIVGYEAIIEAPIPGDFTITQSNHQLKYDRKIQNYLVGKWLYEIYNYSFSNALKDESVGLTDHTDAISIRNAVSEDYTLMRRSLAPLMFAAVQENLKKADMVGFFEIAKVHHKSGTVFSEEKFLWVIMSRIDMKEARKLFDGVLDILWLVGGVTSTATAPYFHPLASGQYIVDSVVLGEFGRVHPTAAREYDLPNDCVYFEWALEKSLGSIHTWERDYVEPVKFPVVSRELNFLLPLRSSAWELAPYILGVDPRISGLEMIGEPYIWVGVPTGMKSVTYRFSIQDRTKTLTDEEMLAIQNAVIEKLASVGFMLKG